MPVPNECLALIIGKNSDTLKLVKNLSGVKKIQIANEGIPGQSQRNVYLTGSMQSFEEAKKKLQDITDKHK